MRIHSGSKHNLFICQSPLILQHQQFFFKVAASTN
jgi:hypothetical protein